MVFSAFSAAPRETKNPILREGEAYFNFRKSSIVSIRDCGGCR